MTSLLEAQHVTRIFGSGLLSKGHTVAVDGVSLMINEDKPSITAIAGESGSGKTTLARLLLGMIQPTSGSILYRGQSLTALDRGARKNFRRERPFPEKWINRERQGRNSRGGSRSNQTGGTQINNTDCDRVAEDGKQVYPKRNRTERKQAEKVAKDGEQGITRRVGHAQSHGRSNQFRSVTNHDIACGSKEIQNRS